MLRAAEKAACCSTSAAGGSCGCAAGQAAARHPRDRARAATPPRPARSAAGRQRRLCCGPVTTTDATGAQVSAPRSTTDAEADGAPATAVGRVAGLRRADRGRRPARGRDRARPRLRRRRRRPDHRPARRRDRQGDRAGHDRRDARPRARQRRRGRRRRTSSSSRATSRTSRCADGSVDVIISNCVINLAGDKPRCSPRPRACCAPAGASRSPTSSPTPDMDEATRADMAAWTGCIAGALTRTEFQDGLDGRRLRRDRDPPRRTASTSTRRRRSSAPSSADGRASVVTAHQRSAINGFGRMGRLALRAAWGGPDVLSSSTSTSSRATPRPPRTC